MKLEGRSLLVFGSRTIDDDRVDAEIEKHITAGGYTFVITALDPTGVCARARRWAKSSRKGLTVIQVGLDGSHARGMWNRRSLKALAMADHMLAIWDGVSDGTRGEIELARKKKVPTTIVRMKPLPKQHDTHGEKFPTGLFEKALREGKGPP